MDACVHQQFLVHHSQVTYSFPTAPLPCVDCCPSSLHRHFPRPPPKAPTFPPSAGCASQCLSLLRAGDSTITHFSIFDFSSFIFTHLQQHCLQQNNTKLPPSVLVAALQVHPCATTYLSSIVQSCRYRSSATTTTPPLLNVDHLIPHTRNILPRFLSRWRWWSCGLLAGLSFVIEVGTDGAQWQRTCRLLVVLSIVVGSQYWKLR